MSRPGLPTAVLGASAPRWMAWSAFVLALVIALAALARPPDVPRYDRFMHKARDALNQGEFDRARKFYRFALTVDGGDAAVKRAYETASMLHRLETTGAQKRVAWLREARKTRGDDPYVVLYAAELAARSGRRQEARALYSRALSIEPALAYARERLVALEEE